jgi:prolyl-tRNA editing enzyme YbaK/EbsC (Cys-tRNA(Pro) deacylase)
MFEINKMIEKTNELMNTLGIKGEIINHPEIDGTHSEVIAKALNVPLECIIKCMILKSKNGKLIAAIIQGNQKIDMKKIEHVSQLKKFSLASKDTVKDSTGFDIGGVPPVAVIDIMPAFVDSEVLNKKFLIGSAGTPYHGLKFNPSLFKNFNYIICDIHEEASGG